MPAEFAVFGKDRILKAFVDNPPDFIVLVHKDTSEFGYRYFGVDYGQSLAKWVVKNYQPAVIVGAPPFSSNKFGMLLLQRNLEQ